MTAPHADTPAETDLRDGDAIELLKIIQTTLRLHATLPQDAEEMAQDAFVELLRRFGAGATVQNLRSWAARVAWDVRTEFFRKAARRKRLLARVEDPLDPLDAIDTSDGAADDVASAAALHRDLAEQLRLRVEQLDEPARTLIRALYYDGLTQRQVAERLGTTRGAVAHQHRRALTALRRTLRGSAS